MDPIEEPIREQTDRRRESHNSFRVNPKVNSKENKLNLHFKNAEELNSYVLSMIESGSVTQTEMAKLLGVSRQRIQQRLARTDPNYNKGGSVDPIKLIKAARTAKGWNHLERMTNHNKILLKEGLHALGKLEAVTRLFRIRKGERRRLRKKQLIEQLQQAAKILGRTPTADDMNNRRAGLATSHTFQQYFKGVAAAQKAAGLPFTIRGPKSKGLPATKEELILDLQRIQKELGRTPTYEDMITKQYSKHPVSRFIKAFGRWSSALRAAGMECKIMPAYYRNGVTRAQALDNLKAARKLKGSTPSANDMINRLYNLHSIAVFQRLFGGVVAAQKAAGLKPNYIDHRYD